MPEDDDKTKDTDKTDEDKTTEDKTTTDDKTTADDKKSDDTFTLKVDGVDKTYTLDELKTAASESLGAQQKFEAASKLRDEASSGRRVMELVTELGKQKTPDEGKTAELLQLLGVAPSAMEKTIEELKKAAGSSDTKSADKSGTTSEPVKVENLDPRLKTIVEAAEQADLERIRTRIVSETEKAVDEDKILGKLIDGVLEGKERDKVRQALHDMANDDVRGRILGREVYGTEMVQSTLQKVRARVENLGIPSRTAGQPPVTGELGALLADYSPEVHATEPIKRVASTEPGYEESAVKRVQQKIVDSMRRGGGRRK